MIKLDIEDYCQDCDRFEANIVKKKEYGDVGTWVTIWKPGALEAEYVYNHDNTYIQCKNKDSCALMMRYLKEKLSKETKENGN